MGDRDGRIKLLFIGITMNCAGTEKAFLSLVASLDPNRYDITLLLAKKNGPLADRIPPHVRVTELADCGEMFLLSKHAPAGTVYRSLLRRHPGAVFRILPYALSYVFNRSKRPFTAARMFADITRYFPAPEEEYDVAAAFWGDRTMFYMCDRIKAKIKLAWLHFDFNNPPREKRLYGEYFSRCDRVFAVSEACLDGMRQAFPEYGDKFMLLDNLLDRELVRRLALEGESYPDTFFHGIRLLTVGRISYQKGSDLIAPTLAALRSDGLDVRWYVIGTGDTPDVDALKISAVENCVADRLILLGTKFNPYPFMRDCDIFVLPSRYEGKPITVEEAKLLLTPIVACDYLSAGEQLRDGDLGVICQCDEKSLYTAVKSLISDSAQRELLSGRLAELDRDGVTGAGEFEAIIDSLLSQL